MTTPAQIIDPAAPTRARAALDLTPIASFDEHRIGCFHHDEPGPGPWEMHPDTDEQLDVLQGSMSVEIHGDVPVRRSAGTVVRRGRRHGHVDADRLGELRPTPGGSPHCDDPAPAPSPDRGGR